MYAADSFTVNLLHHHFLNFIFFLLIGQIKLSLTVQMALLMCQVKPCYFVCDIHGSCMAFPLGFTRSSLGWSRLCDSTRSQTRKGIPSYPSHVWLSAVLVFSLVF